MNKRVHFNYDNKSRIQFFNLQVFRKLTALFKSMGVKAVYDTSSSRDLSLIEACNEFVSRYQQNQLSSGKEAGTSLPLLSSVCPGKNVCREYDATFATM